MGQRLDLQKILEQIKGPKKVYFQPPNNTKMSYPCIVYKMTSADTQFADNLPYAYTKRYQITVIDRNPDSQIPDKVAMLPMCVFDRPFVSDGLHHWVFNLYF